jgi:hypothetical protein
VTRTGPLRPRLETLEAARIAGPGGIGELELDFATVRALRGARLLLVDEVRDRADAGKLGDVNGLGPVRAARVLDALEQHQRTFGLRRRKPAPDPYTSPTRA